MRTRCTLNADSEYKGIGPHHVGHLVVQVSGRMRKAVCVCVSVCLCVCVSVCLCVCEYTVTP